MKPDVWPRQHDGIVRHASVVGMLRHQPPRRRHRPVGAKDVPAWIDEQDCPATHRMILRVRPSPQKTKRFGTTKTLKMPRDEALFDNAPGCEVFGCVFRHPRGGFTCESRCSVGITVRQRPCSSAAAAAAASAAASAAAAAAFAVLLMILLDTFGITSNFLPLSHRYCRYCCRPSLVQRNVVRLLDNKIHIAMTTKQRTSGKRKRRIHKGTNCPRTVSATTAAMPAMKNLSPSQGRQLEDENPGKRNNNEGKQGPIPTNAITKMIP